VVCNCAYFLSLRGCTHANQLLPYLFAFTRHLEVLTLSPAFSSLVLTSHRQILTSSQDTNGNF
jgi:hypothetical protein